MGDRNGMSRRQFLAAVGSAAALVALEGCSCEPAASIVGPAVAVVVADDHDGADGSRASDPISPGRPAPTCFPQIEHIVVVMQENHSYDSYFGMLGRGDGFTLDAHGRPLASNPDAHGNPVRAFHMANTCQSHSREPELELLAHPVEQRHARRLRAQPVGSGRDGLLGRHRPAVLLRARQHVPAVRPLVRVGARPDAIRTADSCCAARRSEPINTIVGENDVPAAEERHDRRDAQPARHLVARLQHGDPVAVPVSRRVREERGQVPEDRPVLRRRGRRQAAVVLLRRIERRDAVRGGSAGHLDG